MSRQLSFTDYEGFVEKFKPKKTTERRPMSPAFHEMLRHLNKCAPPFHIDP